MMAIGALSKITGVNIETIRHYERVGVLPKARRQENGRRCYDEADVRRLIFIRRARELGFELSSVRTLLALQNDPDSSCRVASEIASMQLALVTRRIERLAVLREELARMVQGCSNGRIADCRVIEALTAPAAGLISAPRGSAGGASPGRPPGAWRFRRRAQEIHGAADD
jgi:DNA-binding transcriptional MerR regulator